MADSDKLDGGTAPVEESGAPTQVEEGDGTPGDDRSALWKWSRRAFIGAGGLAGGGFLLGLGGIVFAPNRLSVVPDGSEGTDRLSTWIRITPDNVTTVYIPHCEMGQGALTGIAMLLAEEMEADWSLVRIEQAPADDIYANGYLLRAFIDEFGYTVPRWLERPVDFAAYKAMDMAAIQTTGGSTSTRGTGQFGMRVAGAAARLMLLEAGAQELGVPVEELAARQSEIVHDASGRTASFGRLAAIASTLDVPSSPPLKPRSEYWLVGTSQNRADIPGKVVGEARYGIDVVRPDMVYATIMKAPIPGGQLASVDPAPAKEVTGVHDVVVLPDAVAVVADGYWPANQGLAALDPQFTDGGVGNVDTRMIRDMHAASLDDEGLGEPPEGGRVVTAEYCAPYLSHATMEPMCATAQLTNGRLEIWAGTQDPLSSRRVAANAADLDEHDVLLHNQQLGGGFGRRLPGTYDYVEQAVAIAKTTSPRPVKLVWSREEDMQHGYYRPFVLSRQAGAVDADGNVLYWSHVFTGGLGDGTAATPVYAVEDLDVRGADMPVHLRTGAWRSVAHSQHGFFVESFADELAQAAGRDPVDFRLSLLEHEPRHHAVLERVAEMAGWGSTPPEGRARGVALMESFGSIVAQVAEVSIDDDDQIRVHHVWAAADCGIAVNPQQALAQVQGGIIFGTSATLFHEITVRGGAVEQRNFPDFDMVRLANAPRISVEFVDSDHSLGGLGEPGVPPVAPAIANAVFALTGQRLRDLPLRMT
ncbi:MAG: molybdopterin-dependent oxidoreductase [Gemmatimonadota bacterium]|jgi:isoquinoline 1-oxidoreductase beta subunit